MFSIDSASGVPVYEQLVECVARDIGSGHLVLGDRIPPVRALAEQLGVAAGTVAKAYRVLEKSGVIETHGRHGTFIAQTPDERQAAACRAAAQYLEVVSGQLHYEPEQCLAFVERMARRRTA